MARRSRLGSLVTELVVELNHSRSRLDALSRALAAPAGLTAAGWQVASALGLDELTVPALAHRVGRRRQAVQVAVDDLIGAGFATKVPNPGNVRSPLIQLTPRGQTAFWDVVDRQIAWTNFAGKEFSEEELREAIDVLTRLRRRLDELGEAPTPA